MKGFKPVKNFEKLTVKTISHALFVLHVLKLEGVIDDGEEFYGREDYKLRHTFEFCFDKNFKIQLHTDDDPDMIESLTITLKDKNHELNVYYFHESMFSNKPDVEVKWRFDGPWVRMVEGKIKQIYNAYQFYLDKEKQKKERSEKYFRDFFKDRQNLNSPLKVNVEKISDVLNHGKRLGLVANSGDHTFRYDCFVFQIYHEYSGETTFYLTLRDGDYVLPIYNGTANDMDEITLNESLWANALAFSLEKIKKEIKDLEMERSYLRNEFLNV